MDLAGRWTWLNTGPPPVVALRDGSPCQATEPPIQVKLRRYRRLVEYRSEKQHEQSPFLVAPRMPPRRPDMSLPSSQSASLKELKAKDRSRPPTARLLTGSELGGEQGNTMPKVTSCRPSTADAPPKNTSERVQADEQVRPATSPVRNSSRGEFEALADSRLRPRPPSGRADSRGRGPRPGRLGSAGRKPAGLSYRGRTIPASTPQQLGDVSMAALCMLDSSNSAALKSQCPEEVDVPAPCGLWRPMGNASGRSDCASPVPEVDSAVQRWVAAAYSRFAKRSSETGHILRECAKWLALSCKTRHGALHSLKDLETACIDIGITQSEVGDVASRLWELLAFDDALPAVALSRLIEEHPIRWPPPQALPSPSRPEKEEVTRPREQPSRIVERMPSLPPPELLARIQESPVPGSKAQEEAMLLEAQAFAMFGEFESDEPMPLGAARTEPSAGRGNAVVATPPRAPLTRASIDASHHVGRAATEPCGKAKEETLANHAGKPLNRAPLSAKEAARRRSLATLLHKTEDRFLEADKRKSELFMSLPQIHAARSLAEPSAEVSETTQASQASSAPVLPRIPTQEQIEQPEARPASPEMDAMMLPSLMPSFIKEPAQLPMPFEEPPKAEAAQEEQPLEEVLNEVGIAITSDVVTQEQLNMDSGDAVQVFERETACKSGVDAGREQQEDSNDSLQACEQQTAKGVEAVIVGPSSAWWSQEEEGDIWAWSETPEEAQMLAWEATLPTVAMDVASMLVSSVATCSAPEPQACAMEHDAEVGVGEREEHAGGEQSKNRLEEDLPEEASEQVQTLEQSSLDSGGDDLQEIRSHVSAYLVGRLGRTAQRVEEKERLGALRYTRKRVVSSVAIAEARAVQWQLMPDSSSSSGLKRGPVVRCKRGHALRLCRPSDDGWACDGRYETWGCKSNITSYFQTRGMVRFECRQCNFDLCERCHGFLLLGATSTCAMVSSTSAWAGSSTDSRNAASSPREVGQLNAWAETEASAVPQETAQPASSSQPSATESTTPATQVMEEADAQPDKGDVAISHKRSSRSIASSDVMKNFAPVQSVKKLFRRATMR